MILSATRERNADSVRFSLRFHTVYGRKDYPNPGLLHKKYNTIVPNALCVMAIHPRRRRGPFFAPRRRFLLPASMH